jgi:hypothetical protein
MFYAFLLFILVSSACFSINTRFQEIEILEQKLNRFSNDIKKNECNQEEVASLFLEGTKLLDQIKIIETSMKRGQGKDHTAQFVTIDQLTIDLKRVISQIEAYNKQCATLKKNNSSQIKETTHNGMLVREIGLEENVSPRYNHPSNLHSLEANETNPIIK